ncbi:hypothetical protein HG530_003075 [Fusarium avenaceum]|nr:hypothetical protein HG530_003075 [Fusarium avenaceum]
MLSMSDVLTISITENLLDFHTLLPLDSRDLSSSIVYQSSTNLFGGTLPHLAIRSRSRPSLDCHEPYNFLLGKVAFNINDTDREQASLAHKSLYVSRIGGPRNNGGNTSRGTQPGSNDLGAHTSSPKGRTGTGNC